MRNCVTERWLNCPIFKMRPRWKHSANPAFTLIELLVVLAVIGVLTGLLFAVLKPIKKKKAIALAQSQLKQAETAIDDYHSKYGFYPPDNPGNPVVHQLYFELAGTVLTNLNGTPTYVTLDGKAQIEATATAFQTAFGPATAVKGFVNSAKSPRSSDDTTTAINFLKDLTPNQSGALSAGSEIRLLTCSVLWNQPPYPVATGDPPGMNPWRYVSTSPTNNPKSYDLWVDLLIGGKTVRVGN